MQGIYLHGSRPKSKKQVRDYVDGMYAETDANDGFGLVFEATSIAENEYDGSLASMPQTDKIHFVGPDPHRERKFYGTVEWNQKKERFVVQ